MVDRTERPSVPQTHANEIEHRKMLAVRANASMPKDGTEGMTAPLRLKQYATADLPDAAQNAGTWAYDSTLDVPVYSDGVTWTAVVDAADIAAMFPVSVANGGTGQTTAAEALGEMTQALTEDTTPDITADFLMTYDASADTGKKVKLSTLGLLTSWTPAIAFGGAAVSVTYTTQVGRYIRIGGLVIAWGSLVLSSNGSSTGDVTITGLPFAASTVTGQVYGGAVGQAGNITDAGRGLFVSVSSAAQVADLWVAEGDPGDDYQVLTQTGAGEVTDTARLDFTLIYPTG